MRNEPRSRLVGQGWWASSLGPEAGVGAAGLLGGRSHSLCRTRPHHACPGQEQVCSRERGRGRLPQRPGRPHTPQCSPAPGEHLQERLPSAQGGLEQAVSTLPLGVNHGRGTPQGSLGLPSCSGRGNGLSPEARPVFLPPPQKPPEEEEGGPGGAGPRLPTAPSPCCGAWRGWCVASLSSQGSGCGRRAAQAVPGQGLGAGRREAVRGLWEEEVRRGGPFPKPGGPWATPSPSVSTQATSVT